MEKDIHHTGYKKIIQLDVGSFSLSIMGDDRDVNVSNQEVGYESCIKISFSRKRECFDRDVTLVVAEVDTYKYDSENGSVYIPYRPIFFEQVNYTLYAELIEGDESKLDIWHINQNVRNKIIRPSAKKKNVLSGNINFGNDIGYSDFIFMVNGEEYVTLTIEVFPGKISYKKDYEQIRNDVISELYSLIFDALRKTYTSLNLTSERKASKLEFYTIFQTVFTDFIQSIDCIIKVPHHQLITEHEITSARKVKRVDGQSLRWLETHPKHVCITDTGKVTVDKVNAVKKYITYDTKENRLVRHMVERTLSRVLDFKRGYKNFTKEHDSDGIKRVEDLIFVSRMDRQINIIRNRVNSSFLNDVQYRNEAITMSLFFSMAPGYRELFRCYLKMEQALEIFNDIFHMSQKDLATLYEYWCFIKLNAIVRQRLEGGDKKKLKIDTSQFIIKLKKGTKSEITYSIPDTGEKVVLSYCPEKHNETVLQKPDNVLSIKKHGSVGGKYEYIFDAKYKIDVKSSYAIQNGPGPKEEDINTMHRYRDAIVSEVSQNPGVFRRDMFGAYVLFPYEDVENKYKNHPFFKSIQKVNIGGFPFLPSQTEYVEAQIDKLLQGIGDALDSEVLGESIPLNILIERTENQSKVIAAYLEAIGSSVLKRPN